jgi:putative methionine-R-sulfoxide reductase with GAF domain
MDPHSILDKDAGEMPHQPRAEAPGAAAVPADGQDHVRFPAEDGGKSLAEMAERDLTATLQLLAERAQYITGATGTAIALRDHEEMVCRASAGSSAPEVGAQLQVNSGLSGESVRTRQTLRCDDAATDTRVNRESCEALGIRSVVVMPLLRGDEVIGVFELFSDQANVFETRDLAALERMGAMVHTALEHSAAALGLEPLPPDQRTHPSVPASGNGHRAEILDGTFEIDHAETGFSVAPDIPFATQTSGTASSEVPSPALNSTPGIAFHMKMPPAAAEGMAAPPPVQLPDSSAESIADEFDILEEPAALAATPSTIDPADDILMSELEAPPQQAPRDPIPVREPVATDSAAPVVETVAPPAAPAVRGAVASLRKCEACGFPVSEGRHLCLDCEKKGAAQPPKTALAQPVVSEPARPAVSSEADDEVDSPLPNFLADQPEESWIATHKLVVLAIIIGIVAIVAAAMLR